MKRHVVGILVGLAMIVSAGAAWLLLREDDGTGLSAAAGRSHRPVEEPAPIPVPAPIRVKTNRLVTRTIPREGSIQGAVLRPDGTHVEGAEVRIRLRAPPGQRNFALVSAFDETVTTDSDGRFAMDVPGGGAYRIIARAEGFAPGIKEGARPGDVAKIVLGTGAVLAGVVLEAGTERPLAGVRVIASLGDPHEPFAVDTDGAGAFRIEHLPCGHASVDVDAPEHVIPDAIKEEIVAGETRKITIRLVAGKEITGKVVTAEEERPLADAVVTVGRRTATTDSRGHFVVKGLAARPHNVRVHAWGHLAASRNVNLSGSRWQAAVTFRLQRGATVIGRVLDPDGHPVANAPVRLFVTWNEVYHGNNAWEDQASRRAIHTDEFGQFEIAGIEARRWAWYVTRVSLDGYPDAWSRTVKIQSADDRVTADVRFGFGGTVTGVVSDRDGAAISGARVALRQEGGWSSGREQPTVDGTDETGRFEVAGLTEGRYTVSIDARGFSRGWKGGVIVKPGHTEELTFSLLAGEPLAGSVRDPSGEPLAGVRVEAWAGGGHGNAMTDATGNFEIKSVPKGPWRVRATLAGYATWNKRKVTADPENGIEITLAEQAIVEGRVIDGSTGEPITGFRITFSKDDPKRRRRVTVHNRHVRSEDGRFRVQLPDQTCRLDIQAPGYVTQTVASVRFEAGIESEPLLIELRKGGAIEGYVRDERGNPLPGVAVYRRRNLPFGEDYAHASQTETDGYFFIGDLDAGSHDLVFKSSGRPISIWEGVIVVDDRPASTNPHLTRETTLHLAAKLPKPKTSPQHMRAASVGWNRRSRSRGVSVRIDSLDHTPHFMSRTTRDPIRGRLYKPVPVRSFNVRSRLTTSELPAGRYRLTATMRGVPKLTLVRDVSIGYGETQRIEFDFAALAEPAEPTPPAR